MGGIKKFFLLLMKLLFCFNFLIPHCFAYFEFSKEEIESHLLLTSKQTFSVINSLPQVLSDYFFVNFEKLVPEEKAVIFILKKSTQHYLLNYLLIDAFSESAYKILKNAFYIYKKLSQEEPSFKKAELGSLVIEEIERQTVKRATDYLLEQFFLHEIRVSPGAIEIQYQSLEKKEKVIIQYIIAYFPLDSYKAKVWIRIFSPQKLNPPLSKGSIGTFVGLSYPLLKTKISPFIVDVKGLMEKTALEELKWRGSPEIEISFPSEVADLGLKPMGFWERKIKRPLKEKINFAKRIFSSIGDNLSFFWLDLSAKFKQKKDFWKGFSSGFSYRPLSYFLKIKKDDVFSKKKTASKFLIPLKSDNKQQKEKQKIDLESSKSNSQPNKESKKQEIVLCSFNENQKPFRKRVIINEVAWMGTKNSYQDEWIELRNLTPQEIDLNGWQLINKNKKMRIIFDKKDKIAPYGFYLLERSDEDTVPFKKADKIFTGAIRNKNEALFLFNSFCELEDKVEALSLWPGGENKEKRSMERKDNLSWQTYFGSGKQGVLGTPRGPNSKIGGEEAEKIKRETIKEKNNSLCSLKKIRAPLHFPVIINEIAWMGNKQSSSYEWIELKNTATSPVSLEGWQLIDKHYQIQIVFDSNDIIAPHDFYLLERKSDEAVPSIKADKIYNGSLGNKNEGLYLFNQNCELVDMALALPFWPAGDNKEKRTMERGRGFSWHTSQGFYSDNILGTPGKPNSRFQGMVWAQGDRIAGPGLDPGPASPDSFQSYSPLTVVINEIAWSGTKASSNDEWIELFNNSDQSIDLSRWRLKLGEKEINFLPETDACGHKKFIIEPYSYFLLERTDDNPVSDIDADWCGSFGHGLSDKGLKITLYDPSSNLIDEIGCYQEQGDCVSWYAGDKNNHLSMERNDSLFLGNDPSNWHSNSGIKINGLDANGNHIQGTPRQKNSFPSGSLSDPKQQEQKETTSSQNTILASWPSYRANFSRTGKTMNLGPERIPDLDWVYAQDIDSINPSFNFLYGPAVIDQEGNLYSGVIFPVREQGILILNSQGEKIDFQEKDIDQPLMIKDGLIQEDNINLSYSSDFYCQAEKNRISCYHRDGSLLWTKEFSFENQFNCPVRTPHVLPPAIDEEGNLYLVVKNASCNNQWEIRDFLYVLNSQGELLWKKDLLGYNSSYPTLSNNIVYISNFVYPKYAWQPYLYLRIVFENEICSVLLPFSRRSSFLAIDGNNHLFGVFDKSLVSFDTNGQIRWKFIIPNPPSGWQNGEVGLAISEGKIFLTGRGAIYSFKEK